MHRPRRLFVLLVSLGLLVTACGSERSESSSGPPPADAAVPAEPATDANDSVVVLGDSIMAWHTDSGRSIPDVIGATLGVPVTNAAVSGALAAEVPEQYREAGGDHDWVVFDGGGNDLNDTCGCGQCASVADSIVTADGTSGVLADFTESLVADGKFVAVVGYYGVPATAQFGFDRCVDDLDVHNRRLQAMADRFESVIFVDPSQVVTGTDAAAYDDDDVHPSVEGSRRVGEQIAAAMAAAG